MESIDILKKRKEYIQKYVIFKIQITVFYFKIEAFYRIKTVLKKYKIFNIDKNLSFIELTYIFLKLKEDSPL